MRVLDIKLHRWRSIWSKENHLGNDASECETCGRSMSGETERRKRARVLLRCPLRLYRRGAPESFVGETQDLSSAGFYCMVGQSFAPGDDLDCILTVPAENFSFEPGNVNLHCEVKVTRVDKIPSGFGVACRIDHYSLILR